MNRSRLRAFSLIELLVVIGLIAILSSLLLIGIGHLVTNSKRQATQLAFQNCQAMYAEWDRVARMHFPSQDDAGRTNLAYAGIIPASGSPGVEIPCPQDVSTTGSDRQGYAVLLTRDVMSLLRTMPGNAAALGKMSASATMTFSSQALSQVTSPNYVLDRVQYGTDPNTGAALVGVCIQPTSKAFAGPPDMIYWMPAIIDPTPGQANSSWTQSTVPVLLDGWGNPIIFVPGGMLGYPAGTGLPPKPNLGSNCGMLTAGGNQGVQVRSPDGRPFWASAGPDGDFSLGDDNMYSFEK